MKKVEVCEAEELEIKFKDGVSKTLIFNMKALRLFQDALAESGKSLNEIRDQNLLAFILYAGINASSEKEEFTIEEANALAYVINPASGNEIINIFVDGIQEGMTAEQRLLQKKMMAQIALQI